VNTIHVYDKAKYHAKTVSDYGLPKEHTYNHTTYFLKWLIDNDLVGGVLTEDFSDELLQCKSGVMTINRFYEITDCYLVSDMLNEDGNQFALYYFDFDKGRYLSDYETTLLGNLESMFHIAYSDANYKLLKNVMDNQFAKWKGNN
jgi:hypothetical protein